MTQEFNIIGDIAGNYNTLIELLKKMPKGATTVSVGDMVDRGPRSKQVLEHFMNTPNTLAVMGNHEHLMLDYILNYTQNKISYYDGPIWLYNGGHTTLNSFRAGSANEVDIDSDIIQWLSELPLFLKFDGLVITHGPIRGDFKLEQCLNPSYGFSRAYQHQWLTDNNVTKGQSPEDCVLWHRGTPRRKQKEGLLQVHGHNSRRDVEWYNDTVGNFGVNLDTSADKKLTGMHFPSLELFEQEYID